MIRILPFMLFLIGLCQLNTQAQDREALVNILQETPSLSPELKPIEYNKALHEGVYIMLNAEKTVVDKAIKKYFELNHMCDFRKNKGYFQSAQNMLRELHTDSAYVIIGTEKDTYGTKTSVWLGSRGAMLNSVEADSSMLQLLATTKKFVSEFYTSYYQTILEEEQKDRDKEQRELDKLNKNLSKVSDQKRKAEGVIKDSELGKQKAIGDRKSAEAKIAQYETEKEQKTREQERIQLEIDASRQQVDIMQTDINTRQEAGDTESKEYQKMVKKLEKEKREDLKKTAEKEKSYDSLNKLSDNVNKETNKVNKAETEVRELEHKIKDQQNDIRDYEREIKDLEKQIKNQEQVLQKRDSVIKKLESSASKIGTAQK